MVCCRMGLLGSMKACSIMPRVPIIASLACLISASAQSSLMPLSASPSGSHPRSPGTRETASGLSSMRSSPRRPSSAKAPPARNRVLPVCTRARSLSVRSASLILVVGLYKYLAVVNSMSAIAMMIWAMPAGGSAVSALYGLSSEKAGTKSMPLKPSGRCTSSGANRPTDANMHTRPCFNSALRNHWMLTSFESPKGSKPKSPTRLPSPMVGRETHGRAGEMLGSSRTYHWPRGPTPGSG
mmetsp:Transcript_5872/g.14031  ORF Transcript_5872/g.14031 Transcript_5872/m.14031 type:complete len:240 (+) Transcript_5872:393-1112(+)